MAIASEIKIVIKTVIKTVTSIAGNRTSARAAGSSAATVTVIATGIIIATAAGTSTRLHGHTRIMALMAITAPMVEGTDIAAASREVIVMASVGGKKML